MFRIVFSELKKINAPKRRKNAAVIVSNHPSAFMDPLLIAGLQKPVVFFMTRSDVFTPQLKPILSAANMLPIYRQMDGEGATKKNKEIFEACYSIIKGKRSPLIFGEGLTDDVLERRLKPLKKGAATLALRTIDHYNWETDVDIFCVGLNYEDSAVMGSKVLISNAQPISVSTYKDLYLKNQAQAINELTKKIETSIQEQIVHLEDSNDFLFHEQIMRLTHKGLHVVDSDKSIPLEKRFNYAQKLANTINDKEQDYASLRSSLHNYFTALSAQGISNHHVYLSDKYGKLSTLKEILYLLFLWPIALLGIVLMGLPHLFTKRFVERKFKRKVFWLSVKMAIGMVVGGLYNLIFAFLFYHFIYPNIWLTILFYFTIPTLSFLVYYNYQKQYRSFFVKRHSTSNGLAIFQMERQKILDQMDNYFMDLVTH